MSEAAVGWMELEGQFGGLSIRMSWLSGVTESERETTRRPATSTPWMCMSSPVSNLMSLKKGGEGGCKVAQVKLTVSQDIHCVSGATWRTRAASREGCHKVSRVEKHTEPTHYRYTAAYTGPSTRWLKGLMAVEKKIKIMKCQCSKISD